MIDKLIDVEERIDQNARLQEKAQDLVDYLDKVWESLILEKARIETEIENETS